MKPIYLPIMKHGLLFVTVATMMVTVACMLESDYWKTLFFFCMAQFNFIGAVIAYHLDAIYEKLNPNKS